MDRCGCYVKGRGVVVADGGGVARAWCGGEGVASEFLKTGE